MYPKESVEVEPKAIALSVVIPARNEGRNLLPLLELLAKEEIDGEELEVLVANNSDEGDDTVAVLECFRRGHPGFDLKWINCEKGVANARNAGMGAALADYVLFLDADVRFEDGFLMRAFKSMKEGKKDVVGFDLAPDSGDAIDGMIMKLVSAIQRVMKNTEHPFYTAAGLLVKKVLHDDIGGFDANMIFGEDSDYVQRAKRKGARFDIASEKLTFDMSRFRKNGRFAFLVLHMRNAISMLLSGEPCEAMKREYAEDRSGHHYADR